MSSNKRILAILAIPLMGLIIIWEVLFLLQDDKPVKKETALAKEKEMPQNFQKKEALPEEMIYENEDSSLGSSPENKGQISSSDATEKTPDIIVEAEQFLEEVSSSETQPEVPPPPPSEEELGRPLTVDEALASMAHSFKHGDNRSPQIDDNPAPRFFIPSEEALKNPELYEKEQERSRLKQIPKIHEAFVNRAELIAKNIEEAEQAGTRTPSEIDEAKEALEQLLAYKEVLAQRMKEAEATLQSQDSAKKTTETTPAEGRQEKAPEDPNESGSKATPNATQLDKP